MQQRRSPSRPCALASALALCALSGLAFTCEQPAFEFYVTLEDAGGLRVGSPVLYAGVPVGEVLALSIFQPDDHAAGRVRVHVGVTDPELRVREGDYFRVARTGLLSRPRLEILAGEASAAPVVAGATIEALEQPVLDEWADRLGAALGSLGAGWLAGPAESAGGEKESVGVE